jgi:hypothetical protein
MATLLIAMGALLLAIVGCIIFDPSPPRASGGTDEEQDLMQDIARSYF